MYKIMPFVLAAVIALPALSSCRKVYDYIHAHPDAHDTLCRVTKLTIGNPGSKPVEFDVIYNNKGNPTDILLPDPYIFFTTTEKHFRYDRFDRLSDYITNFRSFDPGPDGPIFRSAALSWQKYAYPRPDIISDTVIEYVGVPIDGPPPIAPAGTAIYLYKFNTEGKMIATAQTVNLPHQPSPTFTPIAYDARGNRDLSVYTDVVYDSSISVYRTNKVWQLVFNDYSRNNPVYVSIGFPFQLPTPTNQFGLPTQLPYISSGAVPNFGLGASTYLGSVYNIEYACSAPRGPINY